MVDKMRHLDLLLQLQGEMFQDMLEEIVSFFLSFVVLFESILPMDYGTPFLSNYF